MPSGKTVFCLVSVVCAVILCLALTIFGIVMLAISSEALEATEFALKYSSASKAIDEERLYEGGVRHWIGPFSDLIRFRNDIQEINFEEGADVLTARSSVFYILQQRDPICHCESCPLSCTCHCTLVHARC